MKEFGQSAAKQEIGHQIESGGKKSDCGNHPDGWSPFQMITVREILQINKDFPFLDSFTLAWTDPTSLAFRTSFRAILMMAKELDTEWICCK
jgi:hypothetical protein